VSFGRIADDPRTVAYGSASDAVDLERSCPVGNSHFRTHLASHVRRPGHPARFTDPLQPGLLAEAADTATSCPPASSIAQAQLSQRTVIDDGPNIGQVAEVYSRGGDDAVSQFCDLYGYQTVEVAHTASIVVEVLYQREYPSHHRVPPHVRLARCRLVQDGAAFFVTSDAIRLAAEHRLGIPREEACTRPELCVCCFRRILVARHTRESERPNPSRATRFANRLARRLLDALDGAGLSGVIPRLSWLNLSNGGPLTLTHPTRE